MQTDAERLRFILNALRDPDLFYDYTPEQIERMKREQQELENALKERDGN